MSAVPPIAPADTAERDAERLLGFMHRHPRLLVLTGAGCSTASGIPDYRDRAGAWKRPAPVTWQAFSCDASVRRRYWARSLVGWPVVQGARPNTAHRALAELERQGRVALLVTQNVDGLHQAAGSSRTVDLHGRLDRVVCVSCGAVQPRAGLQHALIDLNPDFSELAAGSAPDGDADLEQADFARFRVPECPRCGGVLKPDVVFFGENVPRERVDAVYAGVSRCDALLVVGSSLMVRSGLRFVEHAARLAKPVAAINLGLTRAEALLRFRVERDAGEALVGLLDGAARAA